MRGTPQGRILYDHAKDEFAQLFADKLPSCRSSIAREPGPKRFESGSVPSDNCFRLDENQRVLPSSPQPLQNHPEQSVGRFQLRLRMAPLQNGELLPKCHVFQEQVAARPNELGSQKPQQA